MQCPFCKPNTPRPNLTVFDNSPVHMVIVINAAGEAHVHAPWENQVALKTMVRSIVTEMEKRGIAYFNVFGEIIDPSDKKGEGNVQS